MPRPDTDHILQRCRWAVSRFYFVIVKAHAKMIGLLIVTHETLGHAYTALVSHFFGQTPEHVQLLNVAKDEAPESVLQKAALMIAEVNRGHGVLIITDIFGATPCNIARKLIQSDDVAMITGLNAPMMVKAIQYSSRKDDLRALLKEVKAAAIAGIIDLTLDDLESTSC